MTTPRPSTIYRAYGVKNELPRAVSGVWSFVRRPGGWIIAEREIDGRRERVRFLAAEVKGKLGAWLAGKLWHGDVQEPSARGAAGGSDADLVAQFPGKVRKILVKAGDGVEANQPLLLVEAMKMEFAVKAPYAGKVLKVHVQDAQQLTPGTRFVDLEAAKSGSPKTEPKK